MRELWKVKKAVEKYEKLLREDSENAEKYGKEYENDVEFLIDIIKVYIKETKKELYNWYHTNCIIRAIPSSKGNIFLKLKRSIERAIINYFLNKTSRELAEAKTLLEKLKKIQKKFMKY